MSEPMSDARLADIRRTANENGYVPFAWLRDLLAEVQRLRIELLTVLTRKTVLDIDKLNELQAGVEFWKLAAEHAQARLAIFEPPEGERDETLVCRECGIPWGGCGCSNSPYTKPPIVRWKRDVAQKIMGGE